jgi:hypothetical protein
MLRQHLIFIFAFYFLEQVQNQATLRYAAKFFASFTIFDHCSMLLECQQKVSPRFSTGTTFHPFYFSNTKKVKNQPTLRPRTFNCASRAILTLSLRAPSAEKGFHQGEKKFLTTGGPCIINRVRVDEEYR